MALFFNDPAKLALHRLKSIVDHFRQRGVGTVVDPFLIGDQLVAGRDGNVDANPERITFLMGVIRLFDRHIAPVDVIAEFFEACRFLENELVYRLGFIDAAVGNVDW